MQLLEFFEHAKTEAFWTNYNIICFRSSIYPLLFCRQFFDVLKNDHGITVTPLAVNDEKQTIANLKQSFLGQRSIYWLSDVSGLLKVKKSKKQTESLMTVLSSYSGPHTVCLFLNKNETLSFKESKSVLIIDVPETVTFDQVKKLYEFFTFQFSNSKLQILRDVTQVAGSILLDSACMILNYLQVTGGRFLPEVQKYILSLVEPESSLLSLSKAFFTKDEKMFFKIWMEVEDNYTSVFWSVYWSEQLWRAHWVSSFLQKNEFASAKRMSFRLPYSFIKTEWRKCSCVELVKAHQFMYKIDFGLKTGMALQVGSQACSLDLFFSNYFLGQFVEQ